MTLIYIGSLTIIGSDNGLLPGGGQTNIWTNAVILLIGPLGTNFIEILIKIHTFSFKKMHLKMYKSSKFDLCWSLYCCACMLCWINVIVTYDSGIQLYLVSF